MTDIKFQKDTKGNITNVLITDTNFYYCNVRKPKSTYDDRKKPYKDARKEYTVEMAVTEEVADTWDSVFTKQPSKKYTNQKFMEKYKLEDESQLPFPDQKKQYTIKVTQKAQNKDGKPIDQRNIPRIFIADPDNPKKGLDITFDKNVGNGSTGHMSARVNQNDYGSFAYLSKIRIIDLVEYEDGGGTSLSDEEKDVFGFDDVDFADGSNYTPEVGDGDEDSEDDDIPFDDDDQEEY